MPYPSLQRIERALPKLERFHAFWGVTFLSMERTGVREGQDTVWGSPQENGLLEEFYQPQGAPPGKKYFVPFGRKLENGFWRDSKISGSTLQRARTSDNFRVVFQHAPGSPNWRYTANHLNSLRELLPKENGAPVRIPVLDFAAWIFRARDVGPTLNDVVGQFKAEFHIDDATWTELFDASTNEDPAEFFANEPTSDDDLIRLTEGVPPAPVSKFNSEKDLVEGVAKFVRNEAELVLPDGFVERVYFALKAQRFVVLAGRAGTGKTAFARAFADSLNDAFSGGVHYEHVSVGEEQTDSDTIGYENLAGNLVPTALTQSLFLSGRPRDVYIVLLDEMNLAQVDYYLARLLPAIESDEVVRLPGTREPVRLPPDTLIVGTINSFIEEASRKPLSNPVKRRAHVIEMPNMLADIIANDDKIGFLTLVKALLKQGGQHVERRAKEGRISVLDAYRKADYTASSAANSPLLDTAFIDLLWSVCAACSADRSTSLTAGVLQDVLDMLAQRGPIDLSAALDAAISQKIVPQLSGPPDAAKALRDALDDPDIYPLSMASLDALLSDTDPSSGFVFYRY